MTEERNDPIPEADDEGSSPVTEEAGEDTQTITIDQPTIIVPQQDEEN